MSTPTVRVALAIVRRHGRWLVSRRPSDTHLGGLWEFPGGKCEPGETPSQAALRELWEECAVRATPVLEMRCVQWEYPDRRVQLFPLLCEWDSGEGEAVRNQQCRWLTLEEIHTLEFPPANAPILRELSQLLENK